jgi:hypothetical protein
MFRRIKWGIFAGLLLLSPALLIVRLDHRQDSALLHPAPPTFAPEPKEPELVTEPFGPDLPVLVTLPDLSGIDRSLIEPAYRSKPGYCLLAFGSKATTRVWLVEDGETLHVDRDASGDLSAPGKTFQPTSRPKEGDGPYREWTYEVGDLTPADGKHTEVRLVRYQMGRGVQSTSCPCTPTGPSCNTLVGDPFSLPPGSRQPSSTSAARLCPGPFEGVP